MPPSTGVISTFDSLTDYWKGLIMQSPEYAKAVKSPKAAPIIEDDSMEENTGGPLPF